MIFLEHKELGALVERARKGDEDAFRELYEHTARVQYHQLRQLVPDADEAQDALQDTYLLLYQNLDKINPPGCLVAYLNRLTYYVGKNAKKRSMRFHNRMINLDEVGELRETSDPPLKKVEEEEETQTIRKIIEELPEQERVLLVMRYYQRQTMQQIAYSMGISLTTAKRLHRSAKSRVKLRLERLGYHSAFGVVPIAPVVKTLKEELKNTTAPALKDTSGPGLSVEIPANVTHVSPPSVISSGISALATAKTSLVAAVIGVGAITMVSYISKPIIKDVDLPEKYVSAPATLTVTIKENQSVEQARLEGSPGISIPGSVTNDKTLRFLVPANGNYRLIVTSSSGERASQNIHIDCIDDEQPAILSVRRKGDFTEIRLKEEKSGIDADSLYCETGDGTLTLPTAYEERTGTVRFLLPTEDNTLHFSDNAGNSGQAELIYEPPDVE